MPNHKSAAKRVRQSTTRRLANRAVIGRMRSAVKSARVAAKEQTENAAALLHAAVSLVDKAVSRGALKRTTASRYISRLVRSSNKN